MSELVKFFIVRSLVFPVFLWRDHGNHALRRRLRKDGVGIVRLVREQMIGADPLDQL